MIPAAFREPIRITGAQIQNGSTPESPWEDFVDYSQVQSLAIALGLGLLVGLQREAGPPHIAGIRTFALIPLLGWLCAHLSTQFGGWILGAGLLALAGLLVLQTRMKFETGEFVAGMTTATSALLMYAVGALLAVGEIVVAVILGGAVTVLLHWRRPLHSFAKGIGEEEMRGIIQLALLALVVLPILPNQSYGPYQVLNPFHIWLMVVLIVGISVGGYIAYRFLGARVGTILGGVLGGVISSTATTVSYARRSTSSPRSTAPALIIMIASTIAFLRVGFEIAVVSPAVLAGLWPLLAIMAGFMALVCIGLYSTAKREEMAFSPDGDPTNLWAAVVFGALYAVVLFGTAAAKSLFSDQGLYAVAAISGLTDMDAITLTATNLIADGRISLDTGARMILLGGMANLVFKGSLVATLGSRAAFKRIGIAFGLSLAVGAGLLAWFPQID